MARKNEGSITYYKNRNLWYVRVSDNGQRIGRYYKTLQETTDAFVGT